MPQHHFTNNVLPRGGLPPHTFGRLVAEFQFASHVPLAGGANTGRHIFLALRVPAGPFAGTYESAVNIHSQDATNVTFAERLEKLDSAFPEHGFTQGFHLAYGSGPEGDNATFLGLADGDFQEVVNDVLYDKVSDLTQGCDRLAVYGWTYSPVGNGIHDVHMNPERNMQDGALAFYFDLGNGQTFAHWLFVKFAPDHVVNRE